jgi:hypothetical protein
VADVGLNEVVVEEVVDFVDVEIVAVAVVVAVVVDA